MIFRSSTDTYTITDTLNVTPYFSVRECFSQADEQKYRVKVISKVNINRLINESQIQTEFKILREVNHPNLIQVKEIIEDMENYYIVTDFYSKYSLSCKFGRTTALTERRVKRIFLQLINLVKFFHDQNIVLRNIKPDTILINDDDQIMLSDLSFATYATSLKLLDDYYGETIYDPPEVHKRMPYRGQFLDIWALGVILFTLLANDVPWHPASASEICAQMMNTQLKRKNGFSMSAFSMIQGMLNVDPTRRYTLGQIFDHEWTIINPNDQDDSNNQAPGGNPNQIGFDNHINIPQNFQDSQNTSIGSPTKNSPTSQRSSAIPRNVSPRGNIPICPRPAFRALPKLDDLPNPMKVENIEIAQTSRKTQRSSQSMAKPFKSSTRRYSLGEKPSLVKPMVASNTPLSKLLDINLDSDS
ncbi:CAMK family protein kinase [Tritrichomonas foetus]|uniref:CAMK family protein kinase n=1 Tax=Tritrichomonas foetus TaxID=1144522 RepID=A0A1J4K0W2_9EUKA|nr:CAMK family protein kinase [Tritrichomonas foetus]|eukprot:OHT05065.1 CAMK family protein kinase [Tritrichomonas foetus]